MSILDKIERIVERAVFGASAAEVVEMRVRLAEQRIIEALDDQTVPEPDEYGYWTRRLDGGLHYHAYDPATDDDDGHGWV